MSEIQVLVGHALSGGPGRTLPSSPGFWCSPAVLGVAWRVDASLQPHGRLLLGLSPFYLLHRIPPTRQLTSNSWRL